MAEHGAPGEPGEAGEQGRAGGGRGGTGGRGGEGGAADPDYATGRRRFRTLVMFSLVLASFSVFLSSFLYVRSQAETNDRQDQECRIFEEQHEVTVERLRATYRYLTTLPLEEYGTNLTVAVLRGLADLETRARGTSVPPHCDAPNIGLPEPNPKLPNRMDFSELSERP